MPKKTQTEPAPKAPAPQASKKDLLVTMLRREGGATLNDISTAMGWLPHSARAMLTGLRKKGFTLAKEKVDGASRYSITKEPAA